MVDKSFDKLPFQLRWRLDYFRPNSAKEMEEKAQRQDQEKAFEDQQGQINSDLNSFSDDNEVYVKI